MRYNSLLIALQIGSFWANHLDFSKGKMNPTLIYWITNKIKQEPAYQSKLHKPLWFEEVALVPEYFCFSSYLVGYWAPQEILCCNLWQKGNVWSDNLSKTVWI